MTRAVAQHSVDEAVAGTRDSIRVAVWTALSRVTGLVRVAVIAAVLGPTFLGNAYQFTNSVPNLVFYGLLGGSLVSSILVPALVRALTAGDPDAAAALARGLLGCAVAAAALAVPVIMLVAPLVLRTTNGGDAAQASAQVHAATVLIILLAPQIVCYAVIACCVAVMNAHRRFAIAAAAPMIENLGSIGVLLIVLARYGSGQEVTAAGTGEIVLLGAGTTAAVVVHAAVQWFGARRCGTTLRPTAGWRDRTVRVVAARSGYAALQAGIWTVQLIVALALANRVPGGVVAVLIATNFFFLPIALGATPIALAALPRLAAHHAAGRPSAFDDGAARALSFAVFVTAPAAAGYLVLAPRLADVVTFGSAATAGARELVTHAVAGLSLGVLGTGVFTVATYLCYARDDARSPVLSMLLQAGVAVPLMLGSLAVQGDRALLVVTGALAIGALLGAVVQVRRAGLSARRVRRLSRSVRDTAVCVALMAPATWWCDHVLGEHLSTRSGQTATLAVSVALGALVYLAAQRLLRSPDLALVTRSVRRRAATAEVLP